MEQEASLDKLLKMDIDKSNSNVQEILDNIRQTYVLVNQQLDETRVSEIAKDILIQIRKSYSSEKEK